ncbi:MAG: MBL fold metallo-hydrolase [Clostridia bacterium]|nr:MBL fold metallo-hydrolase [Clostridia bacterium]
MELTVFGKYGPYAENGGKTSGYLLETANGTFPFEMGSGVFSSLVGKTRPEKVSAVIISHFHSDHVSDLGVYNYYLESLFRRGLFSGVIRLIVPDEDCAALSLIEGMKFFRTERVKGGDIISIGGTSFEFFNARHPVTCLGFRCFSEGKSFVYSGDTDECSDLKKNLTGADLALLDGAFLSEKYRAGGPHMSAKICSHLSAEYGVKTIVTHLQPDYAENEYGKDIGDNALCSIAEEGKTYTI